MREKITFGIVILIVVLAVAGLVYWSSIQSPNNSPKPSPTIIPTDSSNYPTIDTLTPSNNTITVFEQQKRIVIVDYNHFEFTKVDNELAVYPPLHFWNATYPHDEIGRQYIISEPKLNETYQWTNGINITFVEIHVDRYVIKVG